MKKIFKYGFKVNLPVVVALSVGIGYLLETVGFMQSCDFFMCSGPGMFLFLFPLLPTIFLCTDLMGDFCSSLTNSFNGNDYIPFVVVTFFIYFFIGLFIDLLIKLTKIVIKKISRNEPAPPAPRV